MTTTERLARRAALVRISLDDNPTADDFALILGNDATDADREAIAALGA